jgi:hypothetical protein
MFLKKVGILSLCLILFLCSIVSAEEYAGNFTLPAYARTTRTVELGNGEVISGYVRASGGPANDIIFYVTDPHNETVLFYENTTYTDFVFTASVTGNYTLHFDNSLSMYPKGIRLEYDITPLILGISQDVFYLIVEILIIVIIAVLAIVVVLVWRRRKHAKQQQE